MTSNEIKIYITPYAYAKMLYLTEHCHGSIQLYGSVDDKATIRDIYARRPDCVYSIGVSIFVVPTQAELTIVENQSLAYSYDCDVLFAINKITKETSGQIYLNFHGIQYTTSACLEIDWATYFQGSNKDEWDKTLADIPIDGVPILSPKPLDGTSFNEEEEKEAEEWFEKMLHPPTTPAITSQTTGSSYWSYDDFDGAYSTRPIDKTTQVPLSQDSSSSVKSPYESRTDYEEVDWQTIDWSIPDDELEEYIVCDKTGKVFKKKIEVKAA